MNLWDIALNSDPVAEDRIASKTDGAGGIDLFGGLLGAIERDRAAERNLTIARADLDARQARDDKLFSLQMKQLTPATAPLPTQAGGLWGFPSTAAPGSPATMGGFNPMQLLTWALVAAALFLGVKAAAK